MINRAIFDSGIFIGAKYPKDQYNKEALNIIDNFREGNIDKIYITNFVLLETVNFLLSSDPSWFLMHFLSYVDSFLFRFMHK